MTTNRSWASYRPTYREQEIKMIANWIISGESGSVVGLSGSGLTNLLGFLCERSEAIRQHLPADKQVALISLDIHDLPSKNLSTLYRVILRAIHRSSEQLDRTLQQTISTIYHENRAEQDPFLSQSALQEILLSFQNQQIQAVLVLNGFDRFCKVMEPQMINTLRGLRDRFKDTLTFVAGMTQDVTYLPNPEALGSMYELLDSHICWVGVMNDADARSLIAQSVHGATHPPTEDDIKLMIRLTGRFPALLRGVCYWWRTTEKRPKQTKWEQNLLEERNIQYRLAKVWQGLTQEEQFLISGLLKMPKSEGKKSNKKERPSNEVVHKKARLLTRLAHKGICHLTETGWQIRADLLAAYIARAENRGRGLIWLDPQTHMLYQGHTPIPNLTNLEQLVLAFLVKNPQVKHTKTDLIISTWPKELSQEGVSDNSLYQIIFAIRQAIEPMPGQFIYLINWRGKPEGGYQFFPEGRPA